jgi:predicted DCC family thiol-disulfide oxidoreductase YuxK
MLDEQDLATGGQRRRGPFQLTRSRFIGVVVACAILWALFAWGVMPKLIRDAYNGHGISILVKELEHKANYPVEHYLGKWNKAALGLLGAWLAAAAVLLATTTRWFAVHVARTATPGTLGAIRMVICLILAWVMWWTRLREITPLPDSQRISMGVMNFFYAMGLAKIVHSVVALQTLKYLCIAFCLLGAIGYRTRIVLPLAALLYLPLQGITRSYFWFNHCGIIPFYCLLVLCLVRSNDGWSVDRLIRIWRGQDVVPANLATSYYGWARLAIWLCVAIPYMCAGMSKLRFASPYWWDGNNMQAILFADGLRPGGETLAMKILWVPGWFFMLMGIGTIITEVGFILVPFWRVARMILPISMFGMHMGIWTLMGINFYDLLFIQCIFYDWTPMRDGFARMLAGKRGTITVLFDGNCPFCQRTVRTVGAMDLFKRLNIVDFRAADLAALALKHGVELNPSRLEREMIVIKGGQSFGGAQGARVIAGALPALWIVWPLLAIPGLSHIASAVYRVIARNRMGLVKCDPAGACEIEPAPRDVPARPAFIGGWPKSLRTLGLPAGVAFMFWFMLGIWVMRIEFYPVTSMQMFTTYAKNSVVDYYRAYVFYEDGTSEIARFEKMGGGIARYGPTLKAPFQDELDERVRAKKRDDCIALMTRSANHWNTSNPPSGKRIVRVETHHKQWDFVKQRDDRTNWGQTVRKITVEIDPNTGTTIASSSGEPRRG